MDKLMRRKQLLEVIGLSAATQWRLEKAGQFPARVKLGAGSVGWHLEEVEKWLENRERVSRQYVVREQGRRASDRILKSGLAEGVITPNDPSPST